MKVKVGITGGAGYTAGELIRLLLNHPAAELAFVHSDSNAGNLLSDVHQGIWGDTEMRFTDKVDLDAADVLFLCSGHGRSAAFWESHQKPGKLKVIDLAQDFRDEHDGYVYGLPEWKKDRISSADKVANPGCFATCIQLALMPLASAGLLKGQVSVSAITGSTGAGVKPGPTTHFSWRNNNVSAYKVFEHQHLLEINRNLALLSSGESTVDAGDAFRIDFIPMRGDFARGIFATATVRCTLDQPEAEDLFRRCYADSAFTFVCDRPVDLKDVVNTNKALIHIEKHGDMLVVSSVIDNLLKGASGQAVQNMNLMFGLPERTGLNLKASAF